MTSVLTQLVDELNAGRVRVIDLTQPLDSETPVIGLPPMFAASPCFSMEVISRYDERGPAWYWNTLHVARHRRWTGGTLRPTLPHPQHHARRGEVRSGEPLQSRSVARDRGGGHRGAAQDCGRQRKPPAGHRT